MSRSQYFRKLEWPLLYTHVALITTSHIALITWFQRPLVQCCTVVCDLIYIAPFSGSFHISGYTVSISLVPRPSPSFPSLAVLGGPENEASQHSLNITLYHSVQCMVKLGRILEMRMNSDGTIVIHSHIAPHSTVTSVTTYTHDLM